MHRKLALNMIIAQTSLASNITKEVYRGDMHEFRILKAFKVNIKPPRAPRIKEVIWASPLTTWIKANTDGADTKKP